MENTKRSQSRVKKSVEEKQSKAGNITMLKRGQRGVCLMFVSNPRNASRCWSKREASSSQTCHTPYIAYKLWLLHTFCRICLAWQFLKVFRLLLLLLLPLLLLGLCCRLLSFGDRKKVQGAEGEAREQRGKCIKTCWDLSCHTRRTRQVATRYRRSISSGSSSSDCSNCIRELAKMPHSTSDIFTPHMPVYLWHCLRLSLRCVEHLSALKCSLFCATFLTLVVWPRPVQFSFLCLLAWYSSASGYA